MLGNRNLALSVSGLSPCRRNFFFVESGYVLLISIAVHSGRSGSAVGRKSAAGIL